MTDDQQKKPTLNPDDFVITRKRKKYRFAHFANATNCFELEEWQALAGRRDFANAALEVGAGTGLFLVELAALNPDTNYIAVDVKADRLQKGARLALERGIDNIFFVRARADQLLELMPAGSVAQLWLTFSDPFPKKRDAKRRLTAPGFLKIYKKLLVDENAHLLIKTDDHALFDWSLEQLVAGGWHITQLSHDLHDSNLPSEYKIMTTYERKWTTEGRMIGFVAAKKSGA